MPTTQENLMAAFAGESQANRKYLAYAKHAEKEGFAQVSKLFRAAAEAETIHAHAHFRNAGKLHDTMTNLEDALAGETFEFSSMYPEMIKDAEAEGKAAAKKYFAWALAVEEEHARLYKKALDAQGKIENVDYYICSVCGWPHEGPFTGRCPICNVPDSEFYKLD